MNDTLLPLPAQPPGVPWPTEDWTAEDDLDGGNLPGEAANAIDEMFADQARFEHTYSVVVVRGGRLVFERYGGELERWDQPGEPVRRDTPLLTWSMAKSMLHAAVGIAVGDGLLTLDAPASVPLWSGSDDPRRAITLEHLLTMRDGLAFNEDYLDGEASDVIEMLFGSGQDDVARFAADRPLRAEPDTVFNYSSGTSNIVARILGDAVGGDIQAYLLERLFRPIGMHRADPRVDEAGTFVGSSYVYAPAREMAKFGLLYLRDGVWDRQRILPAGWVDHGRRQRSTDPTDGEGYGAHWWTSGDHLGTFRATGYQGQTLMICPTLDLIILRIGKTDATQSRHLAAWRARMLRAFDAAP